MKLSRFPLYFLLTIVISATFFLQCKKEVQPPASQDLPAVREDILADNDAFTHQIKSLQNLMAEKPQEQALQEKFLALRQSYKKMEWAVEYFLPHSARFINGPAVPEVELEENTVLEAEGLQVLEELLFPYDKENDEEISRCLKQLLNKAGTVKAHFETITVNKAQVFDALRNEIFRISSLGIAGFDTPLSQHNLGEMVPALRSFQSAIQKICTQPGVNAIVNKTNAALNFINKNQNRNTFDYALFLPGYLSPIAAELQSIKRSEKIDDIEVTTALRKDAPTFYAKNTFDVNAFVPGDEYKITPEKIAIGKQLFHDPILSKNYRRSCATCHNPDRAFTDGLPKSMSLENNPLHRNTPSLNYAAFQHGQFWDMRKEDLESQTSDVISNKDEMHGNLDEIILKLQKNPQYNALFRKVYKTEKAETWQLQNLLASYIRSLATFSSDFDDYMRGNRNAISARQKEGFNLFVGKAKCAACHFIPLFNGTVPPVYKKTEQEVLGIAESGSNKKMDSDLGRGKFHETVAFLQHSFKTPTLRNISKSGPYMHNGGYRTLEEVMEFYNQGGGRSFGFKIENQTLPEDKLNLTKDETAKIIEFLQALTDKKQLSN